MRKIAFFLILTSLAFWSCSNHNIEPQQLAQKIYVFYKNKKSIHYRVSLSYVYKGQKDTLHTPYEFWLVRNNNDKKLGGLCWIKNYYRPYIIYYDLHDLYIIYPSKHKIRKYYKVFKPLVTYTDWTDIFFKPQWLMTYLTKHIDQVKTYDTVVNKKHYWALEITQIPEKGYVSKIFRRYLINPGTLTPVYAYGETYLNHGKDVLYEWLKFSGFEFDKVEPGQFKKKFNQFTKKWPVIPYNPENPEQIIDKMLKIGQQAPDVTGINVFTNQPFKLSDYFGKVILLDFWYSHCPPCVRAIPHISELYQEHHKDGLEVFGLNSIDPADSNLVKFLHHLNAKYPVIHTQSSADLVYKIIAYPSMYVIGRDGKIAYIEVGYTDKSFARLKQKVLQLLAKK